MDSKPLIYMPKICIFLSFSTLILLYLFIVKNLPIANTKLNIAFIKNQNEGIERDSINLITPTQKLLIVEHTKKKISWSFFSNALNFLINSFIILYCFLYKHI